MPARNWFGPYVLRRLFQLALAIANVTVAASYHYGAQNASGYCFQVSERGVSLRTLQQELDGLHLLGHAEIAWFDYAEGVWRTFYPTPALLPFGRYWTDEVLQQEQKAMLQVASELERRLKKSKESDSNHEIEN